MRIFDNISANFSRKQPLLSIGLLLVFPFMLPACSDWQTHHYYRYSQTDDIRQKGWLPDLISQASHDIYLTYSPDQKAIYAHFGIADLGPFGAFRSSLDKAAPHDFLSLSPFSPPTLKGWNTRILKVNIREHNMFLGKKKDKQGALWLFAINKSGRIYMWGGSLTKK